jgi:hypothetical protein
MSGGIIDLTYGCLFSDRPEALLDGRLITTLLRYAAEDGLTDRPLGIEEVFAPVDARPAFPPR